MITVDKEKDLGRTYFFILEKEGVYTIAVGELKEIIEVHSEYEPLKEHNPITYKNYITTVYLSLYMPKEEKKYKIHKSRVFDNYEDACEEYLKYI
jgi:hypothetical protein